MKHFVVYTKLLTALFLIIAIQIAFISTSWSFLEETATNKGEKIPMNTHYIGRFSIAVPAEMKEGARKQKIRYVEIKEIVWHEGVSHETARDTEWNNFTSKLEKLRPRLIKDKVIINKGDSTDIGKWTKYILYHDQNNDNTEGTWSFLMDTGPTGVWMKGRPVKIVKERLSNKMFNNICNIGSSYENQGSKDKLKGDYFYLKNGAINLPYMWQENSDVRFEEHSLGLTLRIRMHETNKVEKAGLIDKTVDAIATGYASGVKIKKIRSHKRTVAGLNGEEEVLRMTAKDEDTLSFVWEFNGKVNSGESPRIIITMDTLNSNLDEKLQIWDAVLDSMKPMFERKK